MLTAVPPASGHCWKEQMNELSWLEIQLQKIKSVLVIIIISFQLKLIKKIAGRNINNLRYPDDTTLMAESKKELKSLLMKVRRGESEKAGLKLNIQKTMIIESSPITSWQIDGETMKTVTDFLFLGSKITADGDCSHEIKRHLLLGRKAMTNLDSTLKTGTFLC